MQYESVYIYIVYICCIYNINWPALGKPSQSWRSFPLTVIFTFLHKNDGTSPVWSYMFSINIGFPAVFVVSKHTVWQWECIPLGINRVHQENVSKTYVQHWLDPVLLAGYLLTFCFKERDSILAVWWWAHVFFFYSCSGLRRDKWVWATEEMLLNLRGCLQPVAWCVAWWDV